MVIAGTRHVSAPATRRDKPDDNTAAARPACTALVTVLPAAEYKPASAHGPQHDAFFVAQLIAMAQHSPQTRALRRASPQDAQAAYDSAAIQNRTALPTARMLLVA